MKNFTQKTFGIVTSLALVFGPFIALAPSASAASYVNIAVPSNTSLTGGLLLFYTLDGTKFSTTTVTDMSGNGKTGTPSVARSAVAAAAAQGQQAYTTAQSTSWTAPAGVTSVSVVCVGGGGSWGSYDDGETLYIRSAGGGALAYANNITVVPGNAYDVVVGNHAPSNGGVGNPGGASSFNVTTCKANGGGSGSNTSSATHGLGGTVVYGTGGSGGNGEQTGLMSAGGAGGYSGNGGAGGNATGGNGSGGGGGGGAYAGGIGRAGGGVGILGEGTSGAGGTSGTPDGGGGSGGGTGGNGNNIYGGAPKYGDLAAVGAVRIIWGTSRSFPSTNTGDMSTVEGVAGVATTTAPLKTTGKIGQAIKFDGITASTTVGNVSSSVKSVAFWAKVATSTTQQNIIDLNGSGANIEIVNGVVTANGFTSPTIYVDGAVTSTLNNTNWHHVVITTGTNVNASNVSLGVASSTYFGGSLDDLRIYNKALSASEVRRLYGLGN
ncbi:MAG: LamG-like jellyroll fold domain-containing protein [bacterium]|nr:LamG-like jellyroll fold domain-containing protein [bacterium]